jgi:sulfhydrogenase subunit gamma (sulfur reductase)
MNAPSASGLLRNIYKPFVATVEAVKDETPDIKTFSIKLQDHDSFSQYMPGQFVELSVLGLGEAPFGLASSPTRPGLVECTVKKMGKVTSALHELEAGDVVGIRGPFGNGFPMESFENKDVIIVGGGIGLAPLRSVIWYVIDKRSDFGDVTIIYGARTVADIVYKDELKDWAEMSGITVVETVDPGGETADWKGEVGLVPPVLKQVNPSPKNAVAITCGPPIMIKFTLVALDELGFSPENIITTLEMRMKCGLGRCGRCNIGNKYICKDGPVFSHAQLKTLPTEY